MAPLHQGIISIKTERGIFICHLYNSPNLVNKYGSSVICFIKENKQGYCYNVDKEHGHRQVIVNLKELASRLQFSTIIDSIRLLKILDGEGNEARRLENRT